MKTMSAHLGTRQRIKPIPFCDLVRDGQKSDFLPRLFVSVAYSSELVKAVPVPEERKMAGDFRTSAGPRMYRDIMRVIETAKKPEHLCNDSVIFVFPRLRRGNTKEGCVLVT